MKHFYWLMLFLVTLSLGRAVDLSSGEEIAPQQASDWTVWGDKVRQYNPKSDDGHERVFELASSQAYKHPYDLQLHGIAKGAVKQGDVMLLSLNLRCLSTRDETGDAIVTLVCERNGTPWTKSLEEEVRAGREWKKIEMPFVAGENFDIGKCSINFVIGHRVQTLQIADISLRNFHSGVKLKDLPRTAITYDGSDPSAVWRREANERIEKIRKENLVVRVVDGQQRPVAGAEVKVRLLRHAFGFGTAVTIPPNAEDKKKYEEVLKNYFNKALPANALKWWDMSLPGGKDRAIEMTQWLSSMGLRVKGHNLIWPGWKGWEGNQNWDYMPRAVYESRDNPESMRKLINERIRSASTLFAGKVEEWDVINEPYWNDDVMKVLGDAEMAEWFKMARQQDSQARWILNEAITMHWNISTDNLVRVVKLIDKAGAHVDGVGIQCHYGTNLTAIPRVYETLNRLSSELPGKFIQITEFDQYGASRELQADYLRDFMTIVFSHPAVTDFIFWGFWEGDHWKPEAALWDRNWNIQPNGVAYIDLVTKQWSTNVSGATNDKGEFAARGFLGEYEIIVSVKGKETRVTRTLSRGNQPIVVPVSAN